MAEQHGQTLVPQIRFAGFTDPWEQRKLGEVAYGFEYGLNAAASDFDGEKKYLRITDIDDRTREFRTDDLSSPDINNPIDDKYLLKEGDILFARTGASVGKTYLYKVSDGKTYYAGFLIRAHVSDEADAGFIFQSTLTERYKQFVLLTSQRSGQPGINAQEYADLLLPLPSLSEQRRIGKFFSRLDSLITLHQRKYDKLCVLKKSMLDKMFPKGGSLYPEIRFAGFTDPWEQRKLGELCSFSKGCGYSKNNLRDQGTPIILYGRLYTNYETQIHSVDTFVDPLENSVYTEGGEVIVPASGETAEDISIASVVEKPGIILGGDLNIITPSAVVNPVFLALELSYGKPHFDLAKRAQGKSVVHIHNEDIANVFFDRPCIAEQRRIGEFFDRLDILITLHQRKLELLRNIKKSMLDKMFV